MIKKISVILLILLMMSIKSISAATFYNYLPGGKNYLDESNFNVTATRLSSKHSFLVKGNTNYVLSFPGSDRLGSIISIEISGVENYFEGDVSNHADCILTEQESTCFFQTASSEDYLSVSISASNIGQYIAYYGFFGFQLEEGYVPSSYESYIAPFIDSLDPVFSGSGAYIKSYNSTETITEIINNHISVIDEIDGDLSSSIIIISDSYTGNENVVGSYEVELSASDLSGNTAFFSLSIIVKDEIPPVITGPGKVDISINNAEDLMSIIHDEFLVEDDYSGVTLNITEDNYSMNRDKIGTYTVEFEAVDEHLNRTRKSFLIKLVDREAPSIVSSLTINSYLSNPLSIQDIIRNLEFTDNYSDMEGVQARIITDTFEGNEEVPGSYSLNFEVYDESGNTLNETLTIYVIDDILPQIGGPLTYQGSYTENLELSDFIDMISVSDNTGTLSKNDIYIINDTYSNRESITGSYSITFGVQDKNGNESIHTINITSFDDVAPIIYVDNYIVSINKDSTFTENDALKLMLNSSELKEGNYSVNVLIDEYTGNEDKEGSYLYSLEFKNEEGQSYEKDFLLKVTGEKESSSDKSLLYRNIIIYSVSSLIFVYILYKIKK